MAILITLFTLSSAKLVRNVKTPGIGDSKMCKIIEEWLLELEYGKVVTKNGGEKSKLNIVQ